MTKLTECIERGRRQILADLRDGRFKVEGILSFADLHDHVDANEYGWVASGPAEACEIPMHTGDNLTDDFMAFWNHVQDALDAWIKAGGLALYHRMGPGVPLRIGSRVCLRQPHATFGYVAKAGAVGTVTKWGREDGGVWVRMDDADLFSREWLAEWGPAVQWSADAYTVYEGLNVYDEFAKEVQVVG